MYHPRMTAHHTLHTLLETLSSEELRRNLVEGGCLGLSTKYERVKALSEALQLGRIDFEDVLSSLFVETIREMTELVGKPSRGVLRTALVNELLAWFEEHVEVTEPEEDENGEAVRFNSDAYRVAFEKELAFRPEESDREPRDYQREAVENILPLLRRGCNPRLLHVATGGGKTWIANDVVARTLVQRRGPVLWLTRDWQLLYQAARDYSRRHGMKTLGRIGGDNSLLHPLPEDFDSRILYCTLQTFHQPALARRLKRLNAPALVVWDECHWGENARVGQYLIDWCEFWSAPLLGLTATPHPPQDSVFGKPVFSMDFRELVARGVLAEPKLIDPVRTGIPWHPRRAGLGFDFQADSLAELARKHTRNRMIVDHYMHRADEYGKTILFACNIRHADLLAKRLVEGGVAAEAVHSEYFETDNERAIRRFRSGELQVLVNVAKLTHGVDIPDVKTLFLCRPTLSPTLFSQMVGRGARRDEKSGKSCFHIVEFTDNLARLGETLVLAQSFFQAS